MNKNDEWLRVVSLCLWSLRSVLKRVGQQYEIPYNGTSHTSPASEKDMKNLMEHLQMYSIQTYTRGREFNDEIPEARDFLTNGGAYSNTPKAFSTFVRDTRKATYKAQSTSSNEGSEGSETDSEDTGALPDQFDNATDAFDKAMEAYDGELTLEDLEEDLDIEGTIAAMRAMAQNIDLE